MTRRQNQSDPTAQRTAEQSTQSASGLTGGKSRPQGASERDADDLLNRDSEERYDTPRRYEEADTEPATPAEDETPNPKI